ncbi:MAG: GGDEF domain-containing protein [Lachnospiraceae bacterium]|nr:GGDEF domain-containing protein [Lachnospiraceae bacterium]
MNEVFYYVRSITTNPIAVFLSVVLASEWCFMYFGRLVYNKKYFRFEEIALFSALNGVLLTIFTLHVGEIAPTFLLLATPVLLVMELRIVSADQPFTYLFLFIKIQSSFISFYWILVSVVGLLSPSYITGEVIFPLTVFVSGLWCYALVKNKSYPIEELKIMLHNRRVGFSYFLFLAVCVASLFFSTLVLRPIVVEDLGEMGRIQKIFFGEIFLKTSLVFSSGYLLLYMRARELDQKENIRLLSLNLEREEDFRRSTWQDTFLSFYVNITGNQIQEGRDHFTALMWEDVNNYAELFQKMAFYCVHPEDVTKFTELNDVTEIEKNLEEDITTGRQDLRVSPKEMVRLFHLPEELREKYTATKEEWVWIRTKYVYTRDSQSEDIFTYISIGDIHEKIKKSQQLKAAATIDRLTGIYNRAMLEGMIEARLVKAARDNVSAGTMILLDVDGFKGVNDYLGHPMGDKVLQMVAGNLKEIFRGEDIIGRLGGDEFCVFVNGVSDVRIVRERLDQINSRCRREYQGPSGEIIPVSVSIGAVLCKPGQADYRELYQCADQALYGTKKRGKDGYTLYHEMQNAEI